MSNFQCQFDKVCQFDSMSTNIPPPNSIKIRCGKISTLKNKIVPASDKVTLQEYMKRLLGAICTHQGVIG